MNFYIQRQGVEFRAALARVFAEEWLNLVKDHFAWFAFRQGLDSSQQLINVVYYKACSPGIFATTLYASTECWNFHSGVAWFDHCFQRFYAHAVEYDSVDSNSACWYAVTSCWQEEAQIDTFLALERAYLNVVFTPESILEGIKDIFGPDLSKINLRLVDVTSKLALHLAKRTCDCYIEEEGKFLKACLAEGKRLGMPKSVENRSYFILPPAETKQEETCKA